MLSIQQIILWEIKAQHYKTSWNTTLSDIFWDTYNTIGNNNIKYLYLYYSSDSNSMYCHNTWVFLLNEINFKGKVSKLSWTVALRFLLVSTLTESDSILCYVFLCIYIYTSKHIYMHLCPSHISASCPVCRDKPVHYG